VEKAVFFANLPSILLAGVGGTLVSWALISTTLYALLGFTAFQLAVGSGGRGGGGGGGSLGGLGRL
jgi:hypothetical protein